MSCSPSLVNHGILKERERRKRREAVVRQDLHEVEIHGGKGKCLHRSHSGLRSRTGRMSNSVRARYFPGGPDG